jgi:arylsulfatase A-like enzyme
MDRISVGLPPATAVWQQTMQVDDRIVHPAERFPKEAIPFPSRSDLTHSAFVAEQTMAYLERHSDRPFFCIAGFYSPHSPWVAPQEFIDLYDPAALTLPSFPPAIDAQRSETHFSDRELRAARQGYYAMVSEVDHHVGRILGRLDDLGLRQDTIVIFTSDHGEWLGEHLRYGKGYPGHDCVSRVPFIVRWPAGIAAPGRTSHSIIEAVDVVPTLLSCAGIPVPGHLQGRSRLPLIEDREGEDVSSAITEGDGWVSLRLERFRYVIEDNGRETLHDLRLDPDAYHNVATGDTYTEMLVYARYALLRRMLARQRPKTRVWAY